MWIYKITNLLNKKSYIGQTQRNPNRRLKEHLFASSPKSLIHRAIKKYGLDKFQYEIIDRSNDLSDLNKKEEFYIIKYNSLHPKGYNLLPGGNNRRHHPDTCLKMSKSRIGKHNSIKTEFKAGQPSLRRNIKPIIAESLDKQVQIFFSGLFQVKQSGFNSSHVCQAIKGKVPHHEGFTWRRP